MGLFGCNPVDLVVTDQLLPDLSGVEMIAEMKRIKPDVPVLLLTGLVDAPPGFEQADMLLSKGITPPEFLLAITRLISGSRAAGSATA